MKNNIDQNKNTKELIDLALNYQEELNKIRKINSKKFRNLETLSHRNFRIAIDGFILRLSKQLQNQIVDTTEEVSYQLDISCSYIRSHFIINDLILSGDLIEAITLARKNLENLTRLNELNNKPIEKLERKTPNVQNILNEVGKKLYPEFSEIAHFSSSLVGELLKTKSENNEKFGPSLYPDYKEISLLCYNHHAFVSICFSYWLMRFLKLNYKDKYDDDRDERTFEIIVDIANENNIIGFKK